MIEKIKLIDENNEEKEYDILLTFDLEETNKNYMAYTDNSKDENGNIKIFVSSFDPSLDEYKLNPLDDEEYNMCKEIIETLYESYNA